MARFFGEWNCSQSLSTINVLMASLRSSTLGSSLPGCHAHDSQQTTFRSTLVSNCSTWGPSPVVKRNTHW